MKKVIILLAVVAIMLGSLYLFQPHITFEEVRVTSEPEEIQAVYVNVTGDPLCAKLYILDHMNDHKPIASKDPLFLAMPVDLPSPEDGRLAYSENIFALKGYRYQFRKKNKLTNDSKELNSHRFDVIAWKIVTPYKRWKLKPDSGDNILESETATQPVSHELDPTDHDSSQFVKGKYVSCIAREKNCGDLPFYAKKAF